MLAGLRPAPPGLKRFKSFAHSLNLRQDDSQDDFQLHSDNSPFCLDMIEFDCCVTGKQKTMKIQQSGNK